MMKIATKTPTPTPTKAPKVVNVAKIAKPRYLVGIKSSLIFETFFPCILSKVSDFLLLSLFEELPELSSQK